MPKNRRAVKLIGSIIAKKYLLLSLIGEGGFGAVFSAQNTQTKELYAIKILFSKPTALPEQEKDLQYFQREGGTLSRVQHPNIVKIIEIGISEEDLPYLVMELIEGKLLSDSLKNDGTFSLNNWGKIISQLCLAVDAIHQQNIIHRDLKPENIIINNQNGTFIVKLLDFGLAKLIRGQRDDKWLQTLTGHGQIHGTIFYMSPEQCEGKKLDQKTDIYSLGILAYELLAGRPPFQAEYPLSVMMLHLEATPPPLRALRPDVPVEVEIAILKALEKDPANRYVSALEFAQTVDNAVSTYDNASQEQIILASSKSPARTSTILPGKARETQNMEISKLQEELRELKRQEILEKIEKEENKENKDLSLLIDTFNKKSKQ